MKRTPFTRREFLTTSGRGLGLLAFSQWAPLFLAQTTLSGAPKAEKDRTILVLVQLAGGNDGLNTCVPFEDRFHYTPRPTLAIPKSDALPISDTIGFHQSCEPLFRLLKDEKLSVIQNVGYPNPNRSHFRSMEIWETASDSDQNSSTGWLGRYFDNACNGSPTNAAPAGIHLGNETPQAFLANKPHAIHGVQPRNQKQKRDNETTDLVKSLLKKSQPSSQNASFLQHTMMNALATDDRVRKLIEKRPGTTIYPNHPFSQSLATIASLIAGGMETRVYFTSLGGFDTHGNQANQHANLLRTLSDGLSAFQKDLEALKLDDQVVTMTFSEFGRRPIENDSKGTDHGTAAPLFVMGSKVRGGLFGPDPNLRIEKNADLEYSADFRRVYATILDRWLECDSESVLGGKFDPISFL